MNSASRLLIGTLFLASTLPATATVFWSGQLDATDPVFNRPSNLFGLSFTGTAVAYDVQPFFASTSGDYIFESGQGYDGFILVYASEFNNSAPLMNLLGGGDDFTPDPFSSNPSEHNELLNPWTFDFGSKLDTSTNGFGQMGLVAGQQYFAVTTAFGNSDLGAYSNAIGGGPGSVTLGAVPEPATIAALGVGLAIVLRRRAKRKSST